jgi:hypothetical protein
MSQLPKFFITYSWKDIPFAKRLSDDLKASGLEGFFDMYSISPGDDTATRINTGLEECDVYVPILSSATLESPWCKEEINAALTLSNQRSRQGRPKIIPVLIEDCAELMPPLLRSRLNINFAGAYLSALWELLEKGFGIDPATCIYRANMNSGPRIQTGEEEGDQVWWGAYQTLTFPQKDSGKTLQITVDSKGNDLSIELWRGVYNGRDVTSWLKARADVTRSSREKNPTLTWKIEAGNYTIYLVDYVRLDHHIRYGVYDSYWAYRVFPIRDYDILYRIEILDI